MTDTKSKKPRSVNFSQKELGCVKSLVLENPIIETKLHDQKTEKIRKAAWEAIKDKFNSDPLNTRRTIQQLKGAWKRLKSIYKSQKAAERRSRFKTGGGPQSPPPEDDGEMDEIFSEQTPLENIPDDDDDYTDDTVENGINVPKMETPVYLDAPSTTATPRATTPSATTHEVGEHSRKKTNKKVVTFAQEFHKKRMEYLKLEHELKMQVLEEERSYWQIMKQNSLQASLSVSGSMDNSVEKTYHLFSEDLN